MMWMEINVCKKKSELGLVANAYHPAGWKQEFWGQLGYMIRTLSLEEKITFARWHLD